MPSYFEEDIQLWHGKLILLDAVAAKLDGDASHSFEIEMRKVVLKSVWWHNLVVAMAIEVADAMLLQINRQIKFIKYKVRTYQTMESNLMAESGFCAGLCGIWACLVREDPGDQEENLEEAEVVVAVWQHHANNGGIFRTDG